DADLAFARGHHARTVRPDQPRFSARQRALDLHHVEHRNAFGDADDKGDFGLDRFANRIRSASWRHVDHARVAIGLLLSLRYGVEDRQAEMSGAAFARRCAANHLGAVGDRLLGMKRAVLAGETLADDLGALVDENGHGVRSTMRRARCISRIQVPERANGTKIAARFSGWPHLTSLSPP